MHTRLPTVALLTCLALGCSGQRIEADTGSGHMTTAPPGDGGSTDAGACSMTCDPTTFEPTCADGWFTTCAVLESPCAGAHTVATACANGCNAAGTECLGASVDAGATGSGLDASVLSPGATDAGVSDAGDMAPDGSSMSSGEPDASTGDPNMVLPAASYQSLMTNCTAASSNAVSTFSSAAQIEAQLVGVWLLCGQHVGLTEDSAEAGIVFYASGDYDELRLDSSGNIVRTNGPQSPGTWVVESLEEAASVSLNPFSWSQSVGFGPVFAEDPAEMRVDQFGTGGAFYQAANAYYVGASAPLSVTPQNGECAPGMSACGGVCTSLEVDFQNCGKCGNVCDQNTVCNGAGCQ